MTLCDGPKKPRIRGKDLKTGVHIKRLVVRMFIGQESQTMIHGQYFMKVKTYEINDVV